MNQPPLFCKIPSPMLAFEESCSIRNHTCKACALLPPGLQMSGNLTLIFVVPPSHFGDTLPSSFSSFQFPSLQFTSVYYFSLMNYPNKTDETQWVGELTTAARFKLLKLCDLMR